MTNPVVENNQPQRWNENNGGEIKGLYAQVLNFVNGTYAELYLQCIQDLKTIVEKNPTITTAPTHKPK